MVRLNLNSSKNIVLTDQSQVDIFRTLRNVTNLNLGGLSFTGGTRAIEMDAVILTS